jgi:hypothetical protein
MKCGRKLMGGMVVLGLFLVRLYAAGSDLIFDLLVAANPKVAELLKQHGATE